MGALRRSGHSVAPFKVGPDYIDPGYHTLASGRPGRNLDTVLQGAELTGPLYRHGIRGADIAVVEGVMGLFDGRISDGAGSTAEVAALLGAPVVLVVDSRGQSQSLAALLHGFMTFGAAAGVRIAGVILNYVGSQRHREILEQAAESVGLPVLGAVPRAEALGVPSRHLGLVTAAEYGDQAAAAVEAMTAMVQRHVDVAAVVALAAQAAAGSVWDPADVVGEPVGGDPVVAVASGRAFTFGYAEHRELLAAAGAQVVEFDPLADRLPEAAGAVVLPGGFPEQFTAELSANSELRQDIREFPGPIHAECAGLLYLCRDLDGAPMCGVLDARARFTQRLTLGYREAVAVSASGVFDEGQRVTGHEFHRTTVDFHGEPPAAWAWRAAEGPRREGVVAGEGGQIHASYLHTHPAAHPASVARFVARARR